MASIYEPLLEQLVLGSKVAIPIVDGNLRSIQTSWYRYAKGNILCANRVLAIQTKGEDYILQLTTKGESKPLTFRIVE